METYDPASAPDAAEWLELEEEERIDLVASYHRRAKVKLPKLKAKGTTKYAKGAKR